ncbi:hypothetical protein HHI36_008681, partial [Cryptolaemus montrouzieri]
MNACSHELRVEIHGLKEEVRALRDSNIELVKMLTNTNQLNASPSIPQISENESELLSKVNDPTFDSSLELKSPTVNGEQKEPMDIPNLKMAITGKSDESWQIQNKKYRRKKQSENETQRDNHTTLRANIDVEPKIQNRNKYTEQSSSFTAVPKQIWVHVERAGLNITEDIVRNHLEKKFPTRKFTIRGLPIREDARSRSFSVGTDPDLMEDLYKGENWPCNITIKRF